MNDIQKQLNPDDVKLPTGEKLVVSSSPHVRASDSVRKIMLKVLLALIPTVAAGVWLFGFRALAVIAVTVAGCVAAEALWCWGSGKKITSVIGDCSAVVTGVILALNLPAAVPLYVPVIGAFLAIWLGKQVFGGLGYNPFNPAVTARVALLIALPAASLQTVSGIRKLKNMKHKCSCAAFKGVNYGEIRKSAQCACANVK